MTAVIEGLGTSVPATVVTNEDLRALGMDTTDAWIRSRTGIAQRHVAEPSLSTGDLAVEAGAQALKSSGNVHADALLLATMTPDRPCPATASTVAARLGLTGLAFDLNAACSGFVYALATAAGLLGDMIVNRALVIGADVMSRTVDPSDRNTAVLFGDGAGAVVLRAGDPDEPGAVGPFDLGGNGDLADLLYIPAGGSRQPATAQSLAEGGQYLKMDGKEVYRQAVTGMAASANRVLERAGLRAEDVDHLVAHQANARILDAVGNRLGIAAQRRICNVDRYGNTTAGSIPLAMADLAARGAEPGARVLLTAFGAGLSWGSALLRWPDLNPR